MVFVAGWALWFVVVWARYGHPARSGPSDPLLDSAMPVYEVRELHAIRIAASPARAFAAARALDLERSWIVRAIFRGRELAFALPPQRPAPRPFVESMLSIGWGLVAERPGRELVFAAVTQPWRANVVFRPLERAQFVAFDSADYVKIAWTLAVDSLGPEESRFRTETRVVTTDAAARARFRRYWALFSPGIVLIRWVAVRLVRDEAERR